MTRQGSKIRRISPRTLCAALLWGLLVAVPPLHAEPEYIIEIKDHKFVPAELHVPAGTKIRIILVNQDETQEEFDSYSLNREKHVPPKSRVTLFVGPLDAGRYVFEGEDSGRSDGAALGVIVAQ